MANVLDLGPSYVKVTAPTAFEAFSAALDYVGKTHPGYSFVVEGPFEVGTLNGAVVSGSGYVFKALPNA